MWDVERQREKGSGNVNNILKQSAKRDIALNV